MQQLTESTTPGAGRRGLGGFEAEETQSARNLIRYCRVGPGDRVVIQKDRYVDPLIPDVIAAMCREAGGITYVVEMPNPHLDLRGGFGADFGDRELAFALQPFLKMIEGADLWISLTAGYSQMFMGWKAQFEHGVALCVAECFSLDYFRSDYWRFPYELQLEIWSRMEARTRAARTFRVTSRAGTDYRATIPPGALLFGSGSGGSYLSRPGGWTRFPGTCMSFCAGETNGVFVSDYISPPYGPESTLQRPFTDQTNPLVFTIEDSWIVDVKGDYADDVLHLWETKGNKNSRYDTGPMWGTSPKGYPVGWPAGNPMHWYYPFHSSPWMLHLHIGAIAGFGRVKDVSSPIIITPYTYKPTVWLDDEVVVDEGRLLLLDDPVIRAKASKFGDPDQLLTQVSFPDEMFPGR